MAHHTISQTQINDILKHRAEGVTLEETARRVGVSHTTVTKYTKAAAAAEAVTRAKRTKSLEKARKALAVKRTLKTDLIKDAFRAAVPSPRVAAPPPLPAVMQKTAPARLLALGELAQIALDAHVPLEHLMQLARSVYA